MSKILILTAQGTWAGWDQGFQADLARTCVERMPEKFEWLGIDYPASFGPVPGAPNPLGGTSPSYQESVLRGYLDGVAKIKGWNGYIALSGYSQGGEVIAKLLWALMYGELKDHAWKVLWAFQFASPCRGRGRAFDKGPFDNPGEGISRHNLTTFPEHMDVLDYAFKEDMYPCAPLDSYLGLGYDLATQLQIHNVMDLAQHMLGMVTDGTLVPQLTELQSVSGWLKMAKTFKCLTDFARLNAHVRYGEWEIIPGWTPVNHAINHLTFHGPRRVP